MAEPKVNPNGKLKGRVALDHRRKPWHRRGNLDASCDGGRESRLHGAHRR